MNSLIRLSASFLLTFPWTNFSNDRTPINLETAVFPSPDKKSVAAFVLEADGWYHLTVKNVENGSSDDSAKAELTPIFSAQWLSDSKSIITVGHVAHGSMATLFHDSGGKWSSKILDPPAKVAGTHLYRVIYEVSKVEPAQKGEVDL